MLALALLLLRLAHYRVSHVPTKGFVQRNNLIGVVKC